MSRLQITIELGLGDKEIKDVSNWEDEVLTLLMESLCLEKQKSLTYYLVISLKIRRFEATGRESTTMSPFEVLKSALTDHHAYVT